MVSSGYIEKTEVLHIGDQRQELDIELKGKKLTPGDCFVYLGGRLEEEDKRQRRVEKIIR